MELSQYLDMFLVESKEHLQTLNQRLLDLEADPQNHGLLDDIFRSAHTLKGMSATMGFEKIAELTHEMENVLSKLRNGEVAVTTQIVDILFKCLDALEAMVEAIGSGEEHGVSIEELVKCLRQEKSDETCQDTTTTDNEFHNQDSEPPFDLNQFEQTLLEEAVAKRFNVYFIEIGIEPACVMKAVRAYMVFRNLEELGEVIKSLPSAQEIEDEKFDQSFQVLVVSRENKESLEQSLQSISEVQILQLSLVDPSKGNGISGENRKELSSQSPTTSKPDPGESRQKLKENPQTGKKARTNQTVRVDIERLDNLMNLMGELVINKTRLEQISSNISSTDLNETIEHIDRITTDLQNVVMKVRMVPIEQVFSRFPRMVRDMAREMGKEIELIVEGKETELDRTVIDEIGDPLVHLIRNSVDHGVEPTEVRLAAGKPTKSIVKLVARHEGNHVLIEVEDDGKGIEADKLRSKAVEKGIITAKEAEQMDDNAILQLVFMPGFSTAEKVTDVSGRGVGLDAVRTKIESLSGMVEIETKVGVGTKFKIRLPLTLAIIQALLVRVGDEPYAIPLSIIDETTSILPHQINNVQNQEVTLLRGKVLPLIRLHGVLDVPQNHKQARELYVVVVSKGEKKAGLVVDSLIGQQEIVIKSLGKLLTGIPNIAGATILGNGQVSLILDIGNLL